MTTTSAAIAIATVESRMTGDGVALEQVERDFERHADATGGYRLNTANSRTLMN